ncbi:NAD(P)/FAD-dependent oxidoreductase [Chitinophaga sp. Cy-1792]|uniref:FAD-dependent oxidoreductase n=1 Tax=Chitinophaga sp. Cy-1792 TaxID=2608339 RepID=UPI001965691A|nr:NAD(P)/FAD-dependent oxidoreductase [Chitinophaga sp. Cy-1792]
MLTDNKNIAIIGGGPGGLLLARLLQMKGVSVKVYERDENEAARVQGATLDLHYHGGLRAMKAAGLLPAFKAYYRPGAEKGRVIDKDGNILYDEHNNPATGTDFDSEYARPEIDRGDLRNILLAALQPGTVAWNKQFQSMSAAGNQWLLQFKDGSTDMADIVIGADGANSRIRPYLLTTPPVYAGTIIFQGNVPDAANTIPEVNQLLKGGKIYVYADEKFLHISSKGDGSIDFYVSMKKPEDWRPDISDKAKSCAWFTTEFPGWNPLWLSLVENMQLPMLMRPQYCMSLEENLPSFANLTLLGDAAHVMPPSGEGVNLAMLDALELCGHLTGDKDNDLKAALAAYQHAMQHRAKEEAILSMEMLHWMHEEHAGQVFLEKYCG